MESAGVYLGNGEEEPSAVDRASSPTSIAEASDEPASEETQGLYKASQARKAAVASDISKSHGLSGDEAMLWQL